MTPAPRPILMWVVRHLQCAKLLQCWGGKLGTLADTPEGKEAMTALEAMDMEDVRKAIKKLIGQGLDTKKPQRASRQDYVIAMDASIHLMTAVADVRKVYQVGAPPFSALRRRTNPVWCNCHF